VEESKKVEKAQGKTGGNRSREEGLPPIEKAPPEKTAQRQRGNIEIGETRRAEREVENRVAHTEDNTRGEKSREMVHRVSQKKNPRKLSLRVRVLARGKKAPCRA